MTYRILIVDDDLHIREVIRVALKKAGMTVFETREGKEALTRFDADRPNLIIMDIGLRIRRSGRLPRNQKVLGRSNSFPPATRSIACWAWR